MRTLFLLITTHLIASLSAQTIHSNTPSSAPSINQPINFIVPAGSTTKALEKLELATNLFFSYNHEILPKIVSADTWVNLTLAQGLSRMLGKNYVYRIRWNYLVIRTIEDGKIVNGTKEFDLNDHGKDKPTEKTIGFDSIQDTSTIQIPTTKSGENLKKTLTDSLPNSNDINQPQVKSFYQIVSPFVKIETILNKDVISLRSGNRWNIIPNNVIPEVRNHCLLPAIGWNQYDRLMLGLAFFNTRKPEPKWRYTLVPMFSFERKAISGIADISYNTKVGSYFKTLRLGVSALSFRSDKTSTISADPNIPLFHVLKPYGIMELSSPKRGNKYSSFVEITGLISLESNIIFNNTPDFYFGYRLNYNAFKQRPASSLEFKTGFESVNFYDPWINNAVGRFQTEAKYTWNYISAIKKQRSIEVRGYLGTVFKISSGRSAGIYSKMQLKLSGASGDEDVFYDNYFVGRAAGATNLKNTLISDYQNTTSGQQRMDNMGGMGTATFLGSQGILKSVNISVGLPKVPSAIRLFFDGAWQESQKITYWNLAPIRFGPSFYDAGIMIRTGILKISLPLLMNENLAKSLGTIDRTNTLPSFVFPTYKQQLQRGIRFSLNIPLNSGLVLKKSLPTNK
jgi:hypothetical protein